MLQTWTLNSSCADNKSMLLASNISAASGSRLFHYHIRVPLDIVVNRVGRGSLALAAQAAILIRRKRAKSAPENALVICKCRRWPQMAARARACVVAGFPVSIMRRCYGTQLVSLAAPTSGQELVEPLAGAPRVARGRYFVMASASCGQIRIVAEDHVVYWRDCGSADACSQIIHHTMCARANASQRTQEQAAGELLHFAQSQTMPKFVGVNILRAYKLHARHRSSAPLKHTQ